MTTIQLIKDDGSKGETVKDVVDYDEVGGWYRTKFLDKGGKPFMLQGPGGKKVAKLTRHIGRFVVKDD